MFGVDKLNSAGALIQKQPRGSSMEAGYSIGLDIHLCTRGKRIEKLHCMRANPVKRGLVSHRKDWPWSSEAFCRNAGEGMISMDVEE